MSFRLALTSSRTFIRAAFFAFAKTDGGMIGVKL